MTIPDTGARVFTLTPGGPAQLLTQSAAGADDPATVISDNVAGCRVYLGSDGDVDASNGVPLDPGTSQPWSTEGQLWAYADPAGTAPASLRLTSAVGEWQPSPAAIAAQVAAKLLASGVPNVLLQERLGTFTADGSGMPVGAIAVFPVGRYSSAIVSSSTGARLRLRQWDQGPPGTIIWEETIPSGWTTEIKLIGGVLTVENLGPGSAAGVVFGSNRVADRRIDTSANMANGDVWTLTSSSAVTNGQAITMDQSDITVSLEGLVTLYARMGAGTKGRFELVLNDAAGSLAWLCDSAEMAVSSSTALILVRQVSLPAGRYRVQFRATAAQASLATMFATFVPS